MRTILLPIALACTSATGCGDNHVASAPDAGADAKPDAYVPPPPALQFYDHAQAVDVTPDGRTAVFGDISTPENKLFFVDTVTHTATFATVVGDVLRAFATGVSNTGAVSALHGGEPVTAGVWSNGAWIDLPSPHAAGCDQDVASAWDISADGTVVVGATWNGCAVEAFRWSAGAAAVTRLEVIGARLGGGDLPPDNRATLISDDGMRAAGWAMTAVVDRAPAYWDSDGKGHFLPRSADDAPGEILAISADGSVFAGVDALDAVVWRGSERTPIPRLDILLPSDPVFANAMTADGSVIFGAQGSAFFGPQEAFVWSSAHGLRKLSELVGAAGLTIPQDVTLANVSAVSADGTVLVGNARNAVTLAEQVFTLRLPADAIE